MSTEAARTRAMEQTRARILDVARELLGERPDAGLADVAAAAGVVRRTVYGHFPSRSDLVRTLAAAAASEITGVLDEVDRDDRPADEVWAAFVGRVWPLSRRYRVLVALRRGEHGDEIHALLASVDHLLAELVARGQAAGVFGDHLPADPLARLAYATVFSLADDGRTSAVPELRAAAVTSLLLLGVPAGRARQLAAEASEGEHDVSDVPGE